MTLPETIKIGYASFIPGVGVTGETFKMNLSGEKEVALLLALDYWWKGVPAVGSNTMRLGLWRKSDGDQDPVAISGNAHSDMVWDVYEAYTFVTESVRSTGKGYIVFPRPLVLVRAPRLLASVGVSTSPRVSARIYYVIKEVTDAELTALMVKDHA